MTRAEHATPREAPSNGRRPSFLAAVGQAAAFLGSGLNALGQFFFARPAKLPEVSEEAAAEGPDNLPDAAAALLQKAEDRVGALAIKIAPFPGQEG